MDFFSKCDQIRSLLSQPLFNKIANLKACNSIKNTFFNRTPPVAASERILRKKYSTLREKCPNTEFFLVRIFLYSDWIRIKSSYLVFRKIRTRKNYVFGHFSRSPIWRELLCEARYASFSQLNLHYRVAFNQMITVLSVYGPTNLSNTYHCWK